jgi:DNA polymerase-3 subunit alpha
MQIAVAIGNYTMSEADTLRKVMSKKKASEMEKEKPKFLQGAGKRNIQEVKAKKIWEQMETFAEYGFNKSHSTAYAMISYQTAYLKTHYPAEFMAALLTSEKDNRDKIIKHINNCKEMDIGVLPPDINESQSDFSVSGGKTIRFGLAAVKNVGIGAIEEIINARKQGGRFRSFEDCCRRVDLRKVNKRVIESLIKCGAFDSLGHKRRQLLDAHEEIMETAQKHQRDKSNGQVSFFDRLEGEGSGSESESFASSPLPDLPEWDHRELLSYEKETLGFYITGHPLIPWKDKLDLLTSADTANIAERDDKDEVVIAGIISNIREVTTKRKDIMAYVTVEDLKGSITAIFFAEIYRAAFALLHSEEPVLIRGTVDIGEESAKIIAVEAQPLSEAHVAPFKAAHFRIDAMRATETEISELYDLLRKKPGKQDGFLHLVNGSSETVIYLGRDMRLELTGDLLKSADQILGAGATRFS